MLDTLTRSFTDLAPAWLYIALFSCAYLENILPPVPGDTALVFAAYLVGRTQERIAGIFLAITLGSVAGFMTLYSLGRFVQADFFAAKNYRFLPAKSFESAGVWFRRWGGWVIFLNRFLSGIRSVISIVSGIYRIPPMRVLFLAVGGCGIWNLLVILAGYWLGANWGMIEQLLRQYSRIILSMCILGSSGWVIRKRFLAPREEIKSHEK
jgi:membrane protein DedA with SNARE-associated domain